MTYLREIGGRTRQTPSPYALGFAAIVIAAAIGAVAGWHTMQGWRSTAARCEAAGGVLVNLTQGGAACVATAALVAPASTAVKPKVS